MADADNFSRADVPKGGKRKRDPEQADEEGGACKEPRLTAAEAMQIRLLANVPELRDYRKDARGRRRAVCLTSDSLIDAGLSAIVAKHTTVSNVPSEGGDADRRSATMDGAIECSASSGGEISGSTTGGGGIDNGCTSCGSCDNSHGGSGARSSSGSGARSSSGSSKQMVPKDADEQSAALGSQTKGKALPTCSASAVLCSDVDDPATPDVDSGCA